jgi:hypothetical protein
MLIKANNRSRFIAACILVSFIFTSIIQPAYPLSTENMFHPAQNLELLDKGMLASFILNAVCLDEKIVSLDGTLFSNFSDTPINVYFWGATDIQTDAERKESTFSIKKIIPCRIKDKMYYAYLYRYRDAMTHISILNEKEYDKFVKKSDAIMHEVLSKGTISADKIAREEKGRIRYIADSDDSVTSVSKFLEQIEAANLKRIFDKMVVGKKLVMYEKPLLISGGMEIGATTDEKERAAAILSQLLAHYGVLYQERIKFRRALETGVKLEPDLATIVFGIEKDLGRVSNEGEINFADSAFKKRMYIGDVTNKDCKEIVRDVIRAYKHVARHRVKQLESDIKEQKKKIRDIKRARGSLPLSLETKLRDLQETLEKVKLISKEMAFDKIVNMAHISDSVLPTVIMEREENGKIAIKLNETFVKVMYKLKKRLGDDRGTIYDLDAPGWGFDRDKPLGNLYRSILYSIVIHEVEGHIKVENGAIKLHFWEEDAQAERGRGHLYVNILSILFFWFAIVEREDDPAMRASMLLNEYPHMFKKLTEEERARLAYHLMLLAGDFLDTRPSQDNPLLNLSEYESIQASRDEFSDLTRRRWYTPKHLLDEIAGNDRHYSPMFGMSDIIGGPNPRISNAHPEDVGLSLEILTNLEIFNAVISPVNITTSRVQEPKYKLSEEISGTLRSMSDIGKCLRNENLVRYTDFRDIGKVSDERMIRLKAEVLKVKEKYWVTKLLSTLKSLAKEIKGMTVIAIDTDWVPDEQKDMINKILQELEKSGHGVFTIIRKGKGESKEEFAAKVLREQKKLGLPAKNIVVLADQKTINIDGFSGLKVEAKEGEGTAFFAGVDGSKLGSNSYINIVEMLELALRLAFVQGSAAKSAYMETLKISERIYLLIPKARPVDMLKLPEVYNAIKEALKSA